MNYGWRFMTLYRRQEARPSPWKRNGKKQNGCLGCLTNSCEKKRREKQRRKGKIHLTEYRVTEIGRRDKEAFLTEQCKEIEENNRMDKMGKTRHLRFRKTITYLSRLLIMGQHILLNCYTNL